jgi:hypothetical protein
VSFHQDEISEIRIPGTPKLSHDACSISSSTRSKVCRFGDIEMRERNPPEPLDFNELVSLPLEKQSTSVLKWLTDCESFLSDSTADEVSQHQQAFQSAFLNLLAVPTPHLAHVLRDCLGRCFSHIFEKGDRRVLFETVSTLLQKVNQLRVDKEAKQKQYDPL